MGPHGAGVNAWVGASPAPAQRGREKGKLWFLEPEPRSDLPGRDMKIKKCNPWPFHETLLPRREAPRLWESAVFLHAEQKGRP